MTDLSLVRGGLRHTGDAIGAGAQTERRGEAGSVIGLRALPFLSASSCE
jgi:hypothetical protein